MRETSDVWRKIAASGKFNLETKLRINGTEYTKISAPKISRTLMSSPLAIGGCNSATLSVSIMTDDTIGSEPVTVLGRVYNESSTSEWLEFGTFYINQRDTSYEGLVTISCYDAMLKTNQSYLDPDAVEDTTGWPRSMKEVVEEIAYRIGVEVDPRTIINDGGSYYVPYPEDLTMNQVLGYIGACHAGNWIITEENKLRLVPIVTAPGATYYILEDEYLPIETVEGYLLVYKNPSDDDVYNEELLRVPIVCGTLTTGTSVRISCISGSDNEGNAFTAGDDSGYTLAIDNPYITQDIVDDLHAKYNGCVYAPYSATQSRFDPACELGDQIEIGDFVSSVVFSTNLTLDTAFIADLSAPNSEELSEEYPYLSTYEQLKKSLTKEVEDVNDALGDLETDLNQAVADGVITGSEKAAIEKVLQIVDKEKKEADERYTETYNNKLLADETIKADLKTWYTTVYGEGDSKYNTLIAAVYDVVNAETAEAVTENMKAYRTAYEAYAEAVAQYQLAIQAALQNISETYAYNKATELDDEVRSTLETKIEATADEITLYAKKIEENNMHDYVVGGDFSDGFTDGWYTNSDNNEVITDETLGTCVKILKDSSSTSYIRYNLGKLPAGTYRVRYKAATAAGYESTARVRRVLYTAQLTTAGLLKSTEFTTVEGEVTLSSEATRYLYIYAYVQNAPVYITDVEVLGLMSTYTKAQIAITNESITNEVTRATDAEGDLGTKITQTAEEITQTVYNMTAYTYNYIVNGDFADEFNGWSWGSGYSITTFNGMTCVSLASASDSAFINQDIEVPETEPFKIRFKAACASGCEDTARVRVWLLNSDTTLGQTTKAGDLDTTWQEFEFTFESVEAGSQTLQIQNPVSSTTVYVTDIEALGSRTAENSSQISQNADEIALRVTSEDVESLILQDADKIRLQAEKIEWSANASSLDEDGTLKIYDSNKNTIIKLGVSGSYIQSSDFEIDTEYETDSNGNVTAGSVKNGCKLDIANKAFYTPMLTMKGNYIGGKGYATFGERGASYTSGTYSMAIGKDVAAKGAHSFAQGREAIASGGNSHAEGLGAIASGAASHAEGGWWTLGTVFAQNEASGAGAHAEGYGGCIASDRGAHAEGYYSTASGMYSHAGGWGSSSSPNEASGTCSFVHGEFCEATGQASAAFGYKTIASGIYQFAIGKYNEEGHLLSVGYGASDWPHDVFYVTASGKAYVYGDFSVNGTKSRIVDTDYGTLKQYCYETASPLFGDIGGGVTDEEGLCYVHFDPCFAATVSSIREYYVFLQREGEGDLWIAEKTAEYFVVKGTPNLAFAWEAKARQRDYEDIRMEVYDDTDYTDGDDGVMPDDGYEEDYSNPTLETEIDYSNPTLETEIDYADEACSYLINYEEEIAS